MARFHRLRLDPKSDEITLVPFTPEEEAKADALEQERIAGLDDEVKKAIRAEAMKRLIEFMEDADLEVAASIHLLFVRTERAWTAGEQPVVDQMKVKFSYIRDLYVVVKQAISDVSLMTVEQKENFNPITDITWPVEP